MGPDTPETPAIAMDDGAPWEAPTVGISRGEWWSRAARSMEEAALRPALASLFVSAAMSSAFTHKGSTSIPRCLAACLRAVSVYRLSCDAVGRPCDGGAARLSIRLPVCRPYSDILAMPPFASKINTQLRRGTKMDRDPGTEGWSNAAVTGCVLELPLGGSWEAGMPA